MKQEIEQIIRKNLPEERNGKLLEDKEWQPRVDDYQFGFNDCLAQINTSLIADEVLKVVVEEVKKQDTDFWFKLIENLNKQYAEDQMESYLISAGKLRDEIINLLSTFSPNKENKNNE